MTRLEKNAWVELITGAVCSAIIAIAFTFFAANNVSGISYIVIFILAGSVSGAAFGIIAFKIESKYDEREKQIRRKASTSAIIAMFIYMWIFCLVPFFLIGGKGKIAVYILPIILWGSLLIAQVAHSSIIIIQCTKERADEQ